MSGTTPRGDGLLARLSAQAERAQTHFAPTIDPQRSLAARREITAFLADRLDELCTSAGLDDPRQDDVGLPQPAAAPQVFTFWNSPVPTAPPLVRACLAQLHRMHPDAIVLDPVTVRDWIDVPSFVWHLLDSGRVAHFADYVRVALLERHGGFWVDATCYVPGRLQERIAPLLSAGMLYPRWSGRQISNWFIATSGPRHPLISLQRAALEAWWRERDDLPDYFLYHRVFESLLSLVPEARRSWRRVPHLGSLPAHLLQAAMYRPYDPDECALILDASPIHKLSYKYDAGSVPPASILARLVAGEPL
ncbi:capsular polysaccharide synthesis protein [Microbacterium sp.]|uniref:capsular polysaccharide synthesis protein n=1 Tax=Microbacterium sp. TaxID=51671 RepID=UPI0025E5F36A|nr:capsular polysaccharide synthesis protein [Microbacterium sp.]